MVVNLVGRRQLVDAPVEHDGDAVGDHHRLRLIVGDIDRGDPDLLLQRAHIEAHLFPELGVQVGERLVEQQHVGGDDQCSREGCPLLLPT